MKHHQPGGINTNINLWINPEWTPEQAFAVFELINDLRDVICERYDVAIQEQYRELCGMGITIAEEQADKDPEVPF